MFQRTITASDLRQNLRENLDLVQGNEVLQITHRGEPIRVLLTQEHYFALLGRISATSPVAGADRETTPRVSAEERKKTLRRRLDAGNEKRGRRVG
jgi:antitoxin (DNA-binding transcriptional repressor) of toxin-antitoxin stability system